MKAAVLFVSKGLKAQKRSVRRRATKRRSVLAKQTVKRKRKRNASVPLGMVQWVFSSLLKGFVLVGAVAVISISFMSVYHYLLTSPYLKLEKVEMSGVDENIREEVISISGLSSDLTLVALNLPKLKQRMETHPWVRSVELERRFPHTLVVRAEKEAPRALVIMDKIYYMNRWGEIFKEVEPMDDMDFPAVTGVSQKDSSAPEKLARAAHVMRILESERGMWSLAELSEVHVMEDGRISLYFSHLAAEIKLTCELDVPADTLPREHGGLISKLNGLKKVAEHLSQAGRIHQVTGIDLNHVDGAVVSFRQG